jgi:ribosome-interacting GTPase 1
MPANLTPEYKRAEERLRTARTPDEKVDALEEMLRVIPKHKGTDHMQADLKSRIAKLRKESGKKASKGGFSYIIPREGAGQIALAGPPNAGKSALVRALTHAEPEVGEYPFTTREPMPGMMAFEDIAFQLIDLPPLSEQHAESWVFDLVRHADLVWLVIDGERELEGYDEAMRVLGARNIGVYPAGGKPSSPRATVEKPGLLVVTGLDKPGVRDSLPALRELLDRPWRLVSVACPTGEGLDEARRATFEALDLVRVYTKQPGKPPDLRKPFTLPRGATIADLASRIHNELVGGMTHARVWGAGVFDGQSVDKHHVLADRDIVEIHE